MQAQKRLLLDVAAGADLPRPPIFAAATGCLLVVDWDGGQVLAGLPLPKPTGFLLAGGRLQVALWESDEIVTLEGTQISQRLGHPYFNHVHTLDRTPRGLLVSSSGSDLLAEIDGAVKEANSHVSHAEAIRKYKILPVDFTEETGEMTPTLKVKRKVVAEKFADQIDAIYRKD